MKLSDNYIKKFRQVLLDWESNNQKSYPWRNTYDAYDILVAEFMLHRTQVSQVEGIYNQFFSKYPTLEAFSTSDPIVVNMILKPLGLTWRIDAMKNALSYLWEKYKMIPNDMDKLLSVPGIGPYIAGATICFSTNSRVALVDTNTIRVTGRFFNLNIEGEARRRKVVIDAIYKACDPTSPRNYYYSMIDLAHSICKSTPLCNQCPLLEIHCYFGQQNSQYKRF